MSTNEQLPALPSTVSPDEAQQHPQLLGATLPCHIPLGPLGPRHSQLRRPSSSSVRGKSNGTSQLRSPGTVKHIRASNGSFPIHDNSESDAVAPSFRQKRNTSHLQLPCFGHRPTNLNNCSCLADSRPQYPLGDPTDRDDRLHRSSHVSSPMAHESLGTLLERLPFAEQEGPSLVNSPQALTQSNQRRDRQYGYPDDFSEAIYQVLSMVTRCHVRSHSFPSILSITFRVKYPQI
jgi:hypothetical protein